MGLVRQNNGRRIDIEIWALPSNNIENFLAQIPPPLGIRSIALEDGRLVKGFIGEGAVWRMPRISPSSADGALTLRL